jgi:hypothetical protein
MMAVLNIFARKYVLEQIEVMIVLLIEIEDIVDDDEDENDFLLEFDL